MSRLKKNNIATAFAQTQFGVEKSYRYHLRRKAYYKSCDRIALIAIQLFTGLSSLAIFQQKSEFIFVYSPIIAFLFTLYYMYYKPIGMAHTHELLAKQFKRLSSNMILCQEPNDDEAEKFEAIRRQIEQDEPPNLKVLDILMHNEVCGSIGYIANIYHVNWFRRRFSFWNISPPKQWKHLYEYEEDLE